MLQQEARGALASLGDGYWYSATHPNKPFPGPQPDALSLPNRISPCFYFQSLWSTGLHFCPGGWGMCLERSVASARAFSGHCEQWRTSVWLKSAWGCTSVFLGQDPPGSVAGLQTGWPEPGDPTGPSPLRSRCSQDLPTEPKTESSWEPERMTVSEPHTSCSRASVSWTLQGPEALNAIPSESPATTVLVDFTMPKQSAGQRIWVRTTRQEATAGVGGTTTNRKGGGQWITRLEERQNSVLSDKTL